jgi:hypothetical protein
MAVGGIHHGQIDPPHPISISPAPHRSGLGRGDGAPIARKMLPVKDPEQLVFLQREPGRPFPNGVRLKAEATRRDRVGGIAIAIGQSTSGRK